MRQAWHVLEPVDELKWGWALDAICEHLEAVTYGDILHLLINVPPGMMKSLLVNVFWPAWEWGPKGLSHHRFINASHNVSLSIRDNRKCRMLIESDWFQERWPINLMSDQNAKVKFENEDRGFKEVMAFNSMTGSRGHRVGIDDPHSVKSAESDAQREDVIFNFREATPSRKINDQSAIVVIMQRLHEQDVSGVILSEDFGYVHLCLPMRFEADARCSTILGFTDPREVDGELVFPERFNEPEVERLEKSLGSHGTAGQLQQRPSPRGGGIIKEAWWSWWEVCPRILWRRMYVDTAQKTKEENDYSVLQVWGMTDDGRIALLDQMRGKWEAPDLDRNARQFWNKHRALNNVGPLEVMKVEDKVSGTGLIQALRRPYRRGDGQMEPALPVKDIQRNRDKVSRAHSAAPQIEAGNVILPFHAAWIADYVHEFNSFPAGAHDDQCDPTFDAIEDMLGGVVRIPITGSPDGALGPSVIG